jgi:site-specific DNA recombinase
MRLDRRAQVFALRPNLKGRISELERIRDAARADVERAEARDAKAAAITPEALARFSRLAKEGFAVRTVRSAGATFRRLSSGLR